jgi:hypothetical protein
MSIILFLGTDSSIGTYGIPKKEHAKKQTSIKTLL